MEKDTGSEKASINFKDLLKNIGIVLSIITILSAFAAVIVKFTTLTIRVDECCKSKVTAEDILKIVKPYFDNEIQLIANLQADVERIDRRIDLMSQSKIFSTPFSNKLDKELEFHAIEKELSAAKEKVQILKVPK